MSNLILLIKNTLKVTFRKKGNIIVYLFLPFIGVFMSMLIYGSIGTGPLRVGVVDRDSTVLSADFKNSLSDTNIISNLKDELVKSSLVDRWIDAVIIIPRGYSQSVYDGKPLKTEIVSLKGQESMVWLENYASLYTRNLYDLSEAAGGDKEAFDRIYADYKANPLKLENVKLPDQKTSKMITVSTLGFLIMFVMLGAGFTSQYILEEKKKRTYYRICSAPVRARTYIAANTIASLLIVAGQIVIIQLALKYLFRVETYVPGLMMFALLLVFGTSAVGLSLMVTAFSSSSYMASTLTTLILTPTCMLGGCFWSVDFMPDFMQKLSYAVPQRWVLDAIQRIQSGSSVEGIAINIAILAAFAAAMFSIAAYKFSKTAELQKFV